MKRKMIYYELILLILLYPIFMMTTSVYGKAEQVDTSSDGDASDSAIPKRELLLLEDIPVVVVTPARVKQPINESPSTITVLNKEDIRRYGITSLSDILRNVPGMDIMSISATDRNISIRGLNALSSGKILSLVDGRPIYLDFYGTTIWEFLPVSIDDVERIEIIRGPGSALYGTSAFDGVVNIITDSSADAGTKMTAKMNQYGKLGGSIVHSGMAGNLSYKTSVGLDTLSGWTYEDRDAGENRLVNGLLKYNIDDRSHLRLCGDTHEHRGDIIVASEIQPAEHSGRTSHLRVDYVNQDLKCRAFWRGFVTNAESKETLTYHLDGTPDVKPESESCMKCHGSSGVRGFRELPSYKIKSDTFDVELQYSFRPLDRNFITWGMNYRFSQMDSELLDGNHDQNLVAGYIQDQIQLSRRLALTAGLRYDRHPLVGNNFSPRGSIVYSPAIGHAIRASAGRAFRNPSSVFSYLSTTYRISLPILPVLFDVTLTGDEDLSPEWITSFELGYRGDFGSRLKVVVDTFFNKVYGLTDVVYIETYSENALFPGSPGGIFPSVASIRNVIEAEVLGSEIAGRVSITDWLSAHANYSYQRVNDMETGERIRSAPRHKFNPSLYAELGRSFMISVFANYVDRTVWDGVEIDPYLLLNATLNYRIGNAAVGLSAFNLLNKRHKQYPQGEEVGRSMVLSLTHKILAPKDGI